MKALSNYTDLVLKDLSELRKKIDARAYLRSYSRITFWCIFDIGIYLLAMYGIYVTPFIMLKIFFGLLAGIAASAMFVLAHDMAHGALFKSQKVSELIGTIFMLPALNSYRLWCFGHNRIHHGFTSYSPVDWIWRPLTIDEYKNLSILKKALYKMERSVWGCGLHYILKVWWPKMVKFTPENTEGKKLWMIRVGKLVVLVFAIIVSYLYYPKGGIWGIISALILPFIVFNYVMSLIIYLHHTHPEIPFFDDRLEWNQAIGSIFCTTVIHTNWFVEKFITHNILIHTPHHADIRIPFYRLKTAFISIKDNYSDYIHEYKINLRVLFHIFKSCKLYDYKNHTWYSFKV